MRDIRTFIGLSGVGVVRVNLLLVVRPDLAARLALHVACVVLVVLHGEVVKSVLRAHGVQSIPETDTSTHAVL